jgi:hypothetical protein
LRRRRSRRKDLGWKKKREKINEGGLTIRIRLLIDGIFSAEYRCQPPNDSLLTPAGIYFPAGILFSKLKIFEKLMKN